MRFGLAENFAVVQDPPELLVGYVVKDPDQSGGLKVAFDGEGRIIGRSREARDLVAVISNHMLAKAADVPESPVLRLHLPAIVDGAGSVSVLAPGVGVHPVIAERQLRRKELRIVDAVDLDLDPVTGAVTPPGSPIFDTDGDVEGHAPIDHVVGAVQRLVWRTVDGSASPTPGQTAWELARAFRSGSRHERLVAAVALSERLELVEVATSSGNDVLAALVRGD